MCQKRICVLYLIVFKYYLIISMRRAGLRRRALYSGKQLQMDRSMGMQAACRPETFHLCVEVELFVPSEDIGHCT